MSYVTASLSRDWEDYTELHKELRMRAEALIDSFSKRPYGGTPPLVVTGAFGAGKTQLLYHIFKYAWKRGVPAFYVTLSELVDAMRTGDRVFRPEDFLDELRKIVSGKLDLLKSHFNDNYKLRRLWLPEVSGLPADAKPSEAFERAGLKPEEVLETVSKALKQKNETGFVVLIDEVESAYKRFLKLIDGQFRDLVDAVCRGAYGLCLVFSVSYISYHELFLSEFSAETASLRRVELLHIPTVHPDTLRSLIRVLGRISVDKANTLWWLTRGKLGWASYMSSALSLDDYSTHTLLELTKDPVLDTPLGEGVRALDKESLHHIESVHCRDRGRDECTALLRYLLLNIGPVEMSKLAKLAFVRQPQDVLALGTAIVTCRVLTEHQSAVEALMKDIVEFLSADLNIGESEQFVLRVREALDSVLSAFARHDDKVGKEVCLGAPDISTLPKFEEKYIEALLDIVTAYIAENYPLIGEPDKLILEALYRLQSEAVKKISSDPTVFRQFKDLVEKNVGTEFVAVAPWVVRDVMPMYLWNPIISREPVSLEELERRLSNLLREREAHDIARKVEELSAYIAGDTGGDSAGIYLVPTPRSLYIDEDCENKLLDVLEALVSKHVETDRRLHRKFFLLIILTTDDAQLVKKLTDRLFKRSSQHYLLLRTLSEEFPRIKIEHLGSARLSDFFKSLYYLAHKEGLRYPIESEVVGLGAALRRRERYFTEVLRQVIKERLERLKQAYDESLLRDLAHEDLAVRLSESFDKIKSTIARRLEKMRNWVQLYAVVMKAIPARGELSDVLRDLSPILEPHSLIKVESLPSIYQELFSGQRLEEHLEILPLLERPKVRKLVDASLNELGGTTLEEKLRMVIESEPPLLDDFVDMLRRVLKGKAVEGNAAARVFRALMLVYLLKSHMNTAVQYYRDLGRKAMDEIGRLRDLLNSLDNLLRELCDDMRVCLRLEFAHREKASLKIDGALRSITNVLETLFDWASSESIPEERGLILATLTTFGLYEGPEKTFLSNVIKKVREWQEGVNRIYEELGRLASELRKLPLPPKPTAPQEAVHYRVVISEPEDCEKILKEQLKPYIQEVRRSVERYKVRVDALENKRRDLVSRLEGAQSKLGELRRLLG